MAGSPLITTFRHRYERWRRAQGSPLPCGSETSGTGAAMLCPMIYEYGFSNDDDDGGDDDTDYDDLTIFDDENEN